VYLAGMQNEAACLLAINSEGLVLMVSRKDDHNAWGLPGGKWEPADTNLIATAIREAWEETGIRVTYAIPDPFPHEAIVPVITRFVKTFRCTTFLALVYDASEVGTKDEGLVKWAPYSELLKGPFKEYNAALLDRISEIRSTFSRIA
jgi:8-oxo-dGTP pyrophosphatase MutT (NUDIX family)